MKKHKISLRIISLALGMSCAVGVFGACGKSSKPKTDEDIFLAVKEAYENSCAYEGAYTLVETHTETRNELVRKIERISSGDVENGKFAQKSFEIDENNVKNLYEEAKWFQDSGEDWWYYSADEAEKCYKDVDGQGLEIALGGMPSKALKAMVSFTLADSFEELTQAYEQVTAASLSSLQSKFPNASGATEIAAVYENGGSVVQIKSHAKTGGENQAPISYTSIFSLAEKDEKISDISIKLEWSGESQGTLMSQVVEYAFSYTYAFDENLYNSIIPCAETEPDQLDQEEHVWIEFVCQDGLSFAGGVTFQETESTSILFARAKEQALTVPAVAYTVEGWYLDENCTQRFDANTATSRELLNIKKLYAKNFAASDDWALIGRSNSKTEKRLSKAYKIVEGNGFPQATGIWEGDLQALHVEEGREEFSIQRYDFDEVYFDGELTTETSVFVEGGKLYKMEYISVYEDADYNLFEPLLNG